MNDYDYVIKEIEHRMFEDGKEAVGIKQFISEVNQQQVKEGEIHYCEPKQEDIIRTDGVEDKLIDILMNSAENSNQHTDVLTEEKEKTEQKTKLLPKGNKAQQPYVFYFNKCFVNAGFVAMAGGDLAHVNNQIKAKEEESME